VTAEPVTSLTPPTPLPDAWYHRPPMRRGLRRWWLENVMGPLHNHEEWEGPCRCWERQGLRRPGSRGRR
jgi:hypothetical protein